MSSVTWWNRLEPRPRSADLARALEAQVRDAAWFLSRQWAFGEYVGEDAASPAYVQLTTRTSSFIGWRTGSSATTALPGTEPLEEIVETEAVSADMALRVELGQTLEMLLIKGGASAATLKAFRGTFQFAVAAAGAVDSADREALLFARICEGRAIDGYNAYVGLVASAPGYPEPVPSLVAGEAAIARKALDDLKLWVEDLYDAIGTNDAPAWNQRRLEYNLDVVATNPAGGVSVLSADPDREATFDWYSFDVRVGAADSMNPGQIATSRTSVLPMHVRFRGNPNHRFWDFESGEVNFGGIEADKRDLARLMVAEFLLIQGNDWFLVPLEIPVGTLCKLELLVHDVFGGITLVERADKDITPVGERWTMFSLSADTPQGYADFFALPPSAAGALQMSAPIESIRMLRDQLANMAWAVEHQTENAIGGALSGHERDLAHRPDIMESAPTPDGSPLRWIIQSSVPGHWVPLVPVAVDPLSGDMELVPGSVVRIGSAGIPAAPTPLGRVLKPGVRIAEEAVPRSGAKVTRSVSLSRWTDGSTHLWVTRRKTAGAGEGSSGLRFDEAELRRAPR